MLQIPDYLTTYLVISFLLIVSKKKYIYIFVLLKEYDIIFNIYSAVVECCPPYCSPVPFGNFKFL